MSASSAFPAVANGQWSIFLKPPIDFMIGNFNHIHPAFQFRSNTDYIEVGAKYVNGFCLMS
jgi:hypothetical protein